MSELYLTTPYDYQKMNIETKCNKITVIQPPSIWEATVIAYQVNKAIPIRLEEESTVFKSEY